MPRNAKLSTVVGSTPNPEFASLKECQRVDIHPATFMVSQLIHPHFMKTIGIGIIGCGSMARNTTRKLVEQDPRLKVLAIMDPHPESIKEMRKLLKEEVPEVSNHQELLSVPGIDWVKISSWNRYHCEQTIDAFEAGKHVFCQKPLALSLDECLRMREAWRKSGKRFAIGFNLRYSPHYRKIKEILQSGTIGKIVSLEFNETLDFNHGAYIMSDWRRLRENAGTHLLEKCCHDVDLINWIVAAKARRVASFGGLNFFKPEFAKRKKEIPEGPKGEKPYTKWQGIEAQSKGLDPFEADKDIIDNQVAIIEFENEVRATFHTNCNAGIPERRMYILGTEGSLRADVLRGTIEVKRIGFETPLEDHSTSAKGGHGGGDQIQAQELSRNMLEGTPPSVGLQEGLEAAITCFAIDEAMDTGKVVEVAPYWKRL